MAPIDLVNRYRDPLPGSPRRTVVIPQTPNLGTKTQFSIKTLLLESWSIYKQNWLYITGVTLIFAVLNFLPRYLANTLFRESLTLRSLAQILAWFVTFASQLGMTSLLFSLVKGQKLPLTSFFGFPPKTFFKFIILSVFTNFATLIGLILLLVPGIIFATRIQYFPLLLLEDPTLKLFAALKSSWAITKGYTLKLLLIGGLSILIGFLGIVTLGIGLIVTMPFLVLFQVKTYNKIKSG